MKIKVQELYDKGSGKINEDELLIKDNLFAVFDGMSSLVPYHNKEGETGGKLASRTAKEIFAKNNKSLKELAIEANRKILDDMKKEDINTNKKESLWSTFVAVIRLEDEIAQFFQIGDCLIIKINKNGEYKLVTPYYNHDVNTLLLWKQLAKQGITNLWDSVKYHTDKVRREMNINYGTMNGEPEAINFFNIGEVPLKNIKSLILFTDGLFIPKEHPEKPEDWDLFVKLYQESGLKGLLEYVRAIEKADPNCIKYPRFKQHDDVAAIGISFF